MSATDELRRLLDERGVEWHDTKIGKGFITVFEHDGITWIVTEHSSGRLSVKGYVKPTHGHYDGMTPEQAVEATLGSDLKAENAKLRELVDELYPLADYGAMDASELDKAHDLMRELGLDVG